MSEKKAAAPTWPVRSTGDDFWHRDAMSTTNRFYAEEKVRAYAKAQGWGEIRPAHLAELLGGVPMAPWSCTVRDLIAEAILTVRVPVAMLLTNGEHVHGEWPPRIERAQPVVLAAYTEGLPGVLHKITRPAPQQAEARLALDDVARFLLSPSLLADPLGDLKTAVKVGARASKRPLAEALADLAGKLGVEPETVDKAGQRMRQRAKRRRRGGTLPA